MRCKSMSWYELCQHLANQDSAESETNWNYRLDLTSFPTRPDDLHIKCHDGNLILSGTSEVERDENGFKIFSSHIWSKEIQLPEKVENSTIKARLRENNILNLTADYQESKESEVEC